MYQWYFLINKVITRKYRKKVLLLLFLIEVVAVVKKKEGFWYRSDRLKMLWIHPIQNRNTGNKELMMIATNKHCYFVLIIYLQSAA